MSTTAIAASCADAAVTPPGKNPAAALAVAAAALLAACNPSSGNDGAAAAARGTGFDYYVLALAWSPTYCRLEGAQADRRQCGPDRDLAFVVHGLWPQFERGYPQDCRTSEPRRVPDRLADSMGDIMPSRGLVGHEWRTHGTCANLSQADYFAATRAAYDRIRLPDALTEAGRAGRLAPRAVEQAFIAANPGMQADGIAVTCESGLLDEVRICLTKTLDFRVCPQVGGRDCRAGSLTLPAAP